MIAKFETFIRFALLLALFAGATAQGDDRSPISYADFARDPEVLDAQLSPQGDYLGTLRIVDEKRVVVIHEFPSMKVASVLSFPGRNQVLDFEWANDERIIARITQDFGSSDFFSPTGELFAMNADGKKRAHVFGYRAGDRSVVTTTTRAKPFFGSHQLLNPLWDDPKHILIATSKWTRTPSQPVEVVRLNIYNGKMTRVAGVPGLSGGVGTDHDGNVRFAFTIDDDFNSLIHQFDQKSRDWTLFHKAPYGESRMDPVGFDSARNTLLVSNAPGDGPYGVYEYDTQTAKRTEVYRHEFVDAQLLTDNLGNPYGIFIEPDLPRFLVLDDENPYAKLRVQLKATFPDDYPFITSATRDQSRFVVGVRNASDTSRFYLFDQKSGGLTPLFNSRSWIDGKHLGQVRPIRISARDGVEMSGYLTLPPDGSDKNLPLVVMPHGGPHGPRDHWSLDPYAQVMATRGYAVLQVNYRGSGGYGQSFENSGFKEWNGKMQDDLTDSVRWAIKEGIADAERLCIYGWSYGGFASLASVVKEPDLYKCGVPAAGVYDQDIQYREADFAQSRWGPKYIDKVIGPTPADRRAASPIHFVDRIKAPLLVVHGGEDARVPISHANALMKALDKAGKPYETLIKPNEGHGFFKAEHREEFYGRLIDFLDRHIGPKSPYADRSTAGVQSAPASQLKPASTGQ